MKPSASLCVICKGIKKLCGLNFCQILSKLNRQYILNTKLTKEISGQSNEVFVGSYGYPFLAVGPLVAIEEKPVHLSELYSKNYNEIIAHRLQFVRGKQFLSVSERINVEVKELALSIKPVDSEMELTKTPIAAARFSSEIQPMGPSAPLKRFRQNENPKIPKKVDSVIEEGLLATDSIAELTRAGFDNYYITNIFTTGVLGKNKNKKIVPTRWSITAIHEIIAKQLMCEIREFEEINEIYIFHNFSLGNSYFVLFLPGKWEFENFESWSPNSIWAGETNEPVTTVEYESFHGRSDYAEKQIGGYYASRYSVVEQLHRTRRQARVVVIREISEEYIVPIGVFQVQEGVKTALCSKPLRFASIKEALSSLSMKTKVPVERYVRLSNILNQSKLVNFIGW